jgi:hypothetical protein
MRTILLIVAATMALAATDAYAVQSTLGPKGRDAVSEGTKAIMKDSIKDGNDARTKQIVPAKRDPTKVVR